ncbi:hypothetical protein J6P59_05880 [bacterium]|nr:hypothetical protein [bacterium]
MQLLIRKQLFIVVESNNYKLVIKKLGCKTPNFLLILPIKIKNNNSSFL